MRISIFYFSGTGNTRWIVKKVSEELNKLNNIVNVFNIEDCDISSIILDDIDVIGIAFPIHSSMAPTIVDEFILNLPIVNNLPLFTLTTAGYMIGDVGWYETKKLKQKGYNPFLYGNFLMGNNMHLPYLCPLPVTINKKMTRRLNKVYSKVIKIAHLISDKRNYKKGIDPFGRIYGITQRFIAKTFEKMAFKGFSVEHTKCINCELCVKYCPTNNIEFKDNQIKIMDNCMICMRCYNFCPKQAINCTNKTKKKKYRRYKGPEGKEFKSII